KPSPTGEELCKLLLSRKDEIRLAYKDRNTNKALRIIESLSDEVNRFIAEREPWKLIKTDKEATRQVLTDALNAGLILSYYLRPILPVFCDGITELLAVPTDRTGLFDELSESRPLYLPENHTIREYRHLASRISESEFEAMIENEKQLTEPTTTQKPNTNNENNGIVTIDELSKVDLRVALIKEASLVEGADKLLRLSLDVGEEKLRNVFAGIRSSYKPEDLIGMLVVCVANLQPRKMKFGVSEAMILATGDSDSLTLFVPHRNAKPGDRLR
ncbi:MAG: methionine--tRNA ligase subunit beta, partial [Leptonema sp. (in: Bacteria)]|nr:methionine--tRNA ligase subunit beta [Leptonema sp. (in: bacteria)]